MKQFFKFLFASCLGTFVCLALFFMIIIITISSIAVSTMSGKGKGIKDGTVLRLNLKEEIKDRAPSDPFSEFDFDNFEVKHSPGLITILRSIKKAKTDDKIKGIYITMPFVNAGQATLDEIRSALLDFKESGKFIISYNDVYSQSAYHLASVSDKVYLNPDGIIDIKGFNATQIFFKGTLEKLDVEAQIIRHGKYKSAVEPFFREKNSDENREQIQALLDAIWAKSCQDIASSRNISVESLNDIADNINVRKAEDALKYNLVDSLIYKDQLIACLKKELNLDDDESINIVDTWKYGKASKDLSVDKKKIAVVYAGGSIHGGKSKDGSVGSETVSKALRKARRDTMVKAIVFRVNSPGGGALASEVIRREVELAEAVKPVIVSMGNLAASGGYWISSPATKIFASPSTITGSIGVYGVLFNVGGLFTNKLGITFDKVQTNAHSDFGQMNRPLTTFERDIIQESIESIYDKFLAHVSKGRKMETAQVDEVGQGRVWSGADAKEIGLVDEFGGLTDAINEAAKLASLNDYKLIELPSSKDPIEKIFENLQSSVKTSIIEDELGESYFYYKNLKSQLESAPIQARLPFIINID